MAVSAGKYTYKGYDVLFWVNLKSLKATIWKPNSLILIKKFWVRGDNYPKLKQRVIKFIDKINGNNSAIPSVSK